MFPDANYWIEETAIRCTYCADSGWVQAVAEHPCPYCRQDEYAEWREWHNQQRAARANAKEDS